MPSVTPANPPVESAAKPAKPETSGKYIRADGVDLESPISSFGGKKFLGAENGGTPPSATTLITKQLRGMDMLNNRSKFKEVDKAPQFWLSNPYLEPQRQFFETLLHTQCTPDGGLVIAGGTATKEQYRGYWKVAPDGAITALHTKGPKSGSGESCETPYSDSKHRDFGTPPFLLARDGRIVVKTNMAVMYIDTDHKVRKLAGPKGACGDGQDYPSLFSGINDGDAETARFRDEDGVGVGSMVEDTQGNFWVSDQKGCALRKITPDGQVTTVLNHEGLCARSIQPQDFVNLENMAWDRKNNELVVGGSYVTPSELYTNIWRIKPNGDIRRAYQGYKISRARGPQVDGAGSIAVDAQGRIFFESKLMSLSTDTRQILRLDEQKNTVTAVTGGKIPQGFPQMEDELRALNNGTADTATFRSIRNLCIADDGTIFSHDRFSVRRIEPSGKIYTWAF